MGLFYTEYGVGLELQLMDGTVYRRLECTIGIPGIWARNGGVLVSASLSKEKIPELFLLPITAPGGNHKLDQMLSRKISLAEK